MGDGVAHASKHFENLDLIVDMATLTGAQLVATGKKHAGILANKEEVENRPEVRERWAELGKELLIGEVK